jgi:hypothetical protein
MTEEEIQAAVDVNNQRNEEYRRAGILPPQSELPLDLTVEEVQTELIGNSSAAYSALGGDNRETYDIEGAPIQGRRAQPITAQVRSDTGASTPTESPATRPIASVVPPSPAAGPVRSGGDVAALPPAVPVVAAMAVPDAGDANTPPPTAPHSGNNAV